MKAEYRLMYLARSKQMSFKKLMNRTKLIITQYLEMVSKPYLSFSGGKDSLAMLILFCQMGLTDIPVFTQADDLDYPEKEPYCKMIVKELGFTEYYYEWSEVSARQQIVDFEDIESVSGTFTHVIRRFVARHRFDGNVIGLRQEEAAGRKALIKYNGQIYTRKKLGITETVLLPVAYWRGEDIFALVVSTDAAYISVYDHDDLLMPHQIRFSWPLSPNFFDRGNVAELRRNYPEIYNDMLSLNPQLSRYT